MRTKKTMDYSFPHYTETELTKMDHVNLVWAYCLLQNRFEHLRDVDMPDLKEKYRISIVRKFGRSSEKESILSGESKTKGVDKKEDPQPADLPEDKSGSKFKNHPVRHEGCADKTTKDLPVVDEQIELTPEELEEIFGKDVPYKDDPNFEKTYDVTASIPVQHYIKRYHIHVYRGAGKIVAADHVRKMKKGSIESPDLLAEIVNDRCVLQLPMNRISQEFSRNGFHLTRQRMARWCIDFGSDYLEQFVLRMLDLIKERKYLHADETFMTVNKNLAGKRAECRQWVFRTSSLLNGPHIIVFWFDETRATDVLRELFSDAEDLVIICDAYISYEVLAAESEGRIAIATCYTHARRNFTDILKAIPGFKKLSEEEKEKILSYRIVKKIDAIFKKEDKFKLLSAEDRLEHRQSESKTLVDDLYKTLNSIPEADMDKSSALYKAVNYMKNHEEPFRAFLKDGNVTVHNSAAEQAIIPFSIGRNNWKSIDSIDGSITLGYYYSLTETAKANGAIPFYYLKFLFERLPALYKEHNGRPDPVLFDGMMPWTDTYKKYEQAELSNLRNILKTWQPA